MEYLAVLGYKVKLLEHRHIQ